MERLWKRLDKYYENSISPLKLTPQNKNETIQKLIKWRRDKEREKEMEKYTALSILFLFITKWIMPATQSMVRQVYVSFTRTRKKNTEAFRLMCNNKVDEKRA